jgi:hypothetical protein
LKPREGNTSAIIITHGDIDGMICAAQIIRREKSQCEVQFSNARYIASKLRAILNPDSYPAKVYITDIPAHEKLAEVIERLVENGVEIFWIDHHPWEDGLIERLRRSCEVLIHNASMATPAGVLLGRWLSEEDPYFQRVGNICYAHEKGTPWERNWFRLLASYVGKSDRAVLERLAYDLELTQQDHDRIQNEILKEQLADTILAKEPRVEQTNSGKSMAIYDTAGTPQVYLGQKVFGHHPVDYSLVRVKEKKWQIASNPTSGLTLRSIVGEHDLAGLRVTAAGRPDQLLAIEVRTAHVPTDIHEVIVTWVKSRL